MKTVPRIRARHLVLLALGVTASACSSKTETPAAPTKADAGRTGDDAAAACIDTGEHPAARDEVMGVVDPKRGKVLFFGGNTGVPKQCNPAPVPNGDLWSYDMACKSFKKIAFPDGPGIRTRGAAVLDVAGDRMIVFGGRFRAGTSGAYTLYNETWALDLATLSWQKLDTTGTPPAGRTSLAAVYRADTNEMLIFGGNSSTNGLAFTPLADVWALDLKTRAWRQIPTTGTPPAARLFHSAALDPGKKRLYVYGGGDANAFTGPFLGDLWSLDLGAGAWNLEASAGAGAPAARINASMTFDAKAGRLVLFGGHDDGVVGNNNDTWAFDPASRKWTAIVPPEKMVKPSPAFCVFPPDFTTTNLAAPDRRSAHLAAVDTAHDAWIVFGGTTDCGLIDDVWSFDLGTSGWTRATKARVGEACLRGDNKAQCSTLCQ